MSLSVDQLTARPKTIEIGGRVLQVTPLTIDDLGSLQAWIYAQLPDPVASARRMGEGMPASAQDGLFREALKEDRSARMAYRIGTPGASELIQSLLGLVEMLYLGTRKHHPELAKDELPALIMKATSDGIDRVTSHAFGVGADDPGGASDPKGVGAAAHPAP